jgi:isocitrate lyase
MLFIRSRSGIKLLPLQFTRSMTSSLPSLPVQPLSVDEECQQFDERVSEMHTFFSLPRFKATKRTYSPADVVSKQGSMPILPLPSTLLANKLFALLIKAAEAGRPVHTMGAIDPVQMTQMARHQEVVYVSGWAASSVLTTANNEVGPDLGYVQELSLPLSTK